MHPFQCCIPPQSHTWRMSFTGTIEYLEAPDFLLLELFSEVENKFASSKSTKCKKIFTLNYMYGCTCVTKFRMNYIARLGELGCFTDDPSSGYLVYHACWSNERIKIFKQE